MLYDMLYACMLYVLILFKTPHHPKQIRRLVDVYVFMCIFTSLLLVFSSGQFVSNSLRFVVCELFVVSMICELVSG